MTEFKFREAELKKIFSKIEKLLFDESHIDKITYEDINDTALNYSKNNKLFIDVIKGNPIVYCIWLKQKSKRKFVPVYVGHAKDPVERMRAHLSKKDERTGSCLEYVKNAVKNSGTIGITFVKINPSYMRSAVEEWLIDENSNILLWNKHGR